MAVTRAREGAPYRTRLTGRLMHLRAWGKSRRALANFAASLRFRVRDLDDVRPFRQFDLEERCEILGRAGLRNGTDLRETRFHLG